MTEQSLNFARKGIKPGSKLIILSIISVALLMLDNRYSAVKRLKGYTATALYPLQWFANQPIRLYEYISDFMETRSSLIEENKRLSIENSQLKLLSQQNSLLTREIAELKRIQALQDNGIVATSTAEVISNRRDPLSDKLIINKGSRNGLKKGDAVLDQYGLIGQLIDVQPFSSELNLITNSQMVIPVNVTRTGVRSLLYGNGGSVTLRYFPAKADLQVDDVLITSGIDSIYPTGIPVAKVIKAERAPGTPYYRVTLQPLADFQASKYVLTIPQKTDTALTKINKLPS